MIALSYQDATDLAELVSHMESASLPTGHTASLAVSDAMGRHYATIEVGVDGSAVLTIAPMPGAGDVQDTRP